MGQERIKAYKIVSHQFLTLIRMAFLKGSNSPWGKILENVKCRNLPVRFLTSHISSKGELTINLGVDLLSEETVDEVINELKGLEKHYDLALVSQVSMALVYGPHFGEVPGIAGLTLSTLTSAGITLLASTASSSSLSCLFPSAQFKTVLEMLHAIFEPPQTHLY